MVVYRQGSCWGLKMKQKKIELTIEEYKKECIKIIAMGLPVVDTLIMLSDFKASIKIISPRESHE